MPVSSRHYLVGLLGAAAAWSMCCSWALADEAVHACGASYGVGVFAGSSAPDMATFAACPVVSLTQGGLQVSSGATTSYKGDTARFQANAPGGLLIVGAGVPSMAVWNMNSQGASFGGGFYWQGGGQETTSGQFNASMDGFASAYL